MTTDSHLSDDRLLDLVNRLLPAEERGRELLHLRGCPACVNRLHEVAGSHERAHDRALAALGLAESMSMTDAPGRAAPHPLRTRSTRRSAIRTMLAIAAVLALVFLGAYAWRSQRPITENFLMAWLPMPEPSVFLRDSTQVALDPSLTAGLAAYRNHDAKEARRLLGRARAEGPNEAVRLIYLGSSELEVGDTKAALRTLAQVDLSEVPEPWRGETRWTQAVAHAREGHAAAADSLLRLLAERSDDLGERARRMLDPQHSRP